MTTKNLGAVKGIHRGSSAPNNTQMIWYDTNTDTIKYYDSNTTTWKIIVATSVNVPTGNQFIAVSKSGSDGTGAEDDMSTPYLTISAAYTQAKTLSPSTTNPIYIYIFPGEYVEALTIDDSYIYLVGAVPQGSPKDQHNSAGAGGAVHIDGTATVSVTGQKFVGINIDEISLTAASLDIFMHNCSITTYSATSGATTISGTYSQCEITDCLSTSNGQTINGDFYDCYLDGFIGDHILTAKFYNCEFGDGSLHKDSGTGVLSGEYYNCVFGNDCLVTGSLAIGTSVTPIKLHNCRSVGSILETDSGACYVDAEDCNFTAGTAIFTVTGTGILEANLNNCRFAASSIDWEGGTIQNSIMTNCDFSGDGNIIFDQGAATFYVIRCTFRGQGNMLINAGGDHFGQVIGCLILNDGFLMPDGIATDAHTLWGRYIDNIAGDFAFGSGTGAVHDAAAYFLRCTANRGSFAAGGTVGGIYDNCVWLRTDAGFADNTPIEGRVTRMTMRADYAADCLTLTDGAAVYHCDIANLSGECVDSSGATCAVDGNTFNKAIGSGITNAIVTGVHNSSDNGMV